MSAETTPRVSVIVPVYNVAPYLDKCVQSIVDQELSDIEIILVDDGSTDESGALCDAWIERDARIRVIHKENGGLSEARNTGIDAARAPWLGFIDSDDWIAPSMYSRLLACAEENNAQMAVGGVKSVYVNREVVVGDGGKFIMNRSEAFKEFMSGERLRIWVPVKLYARSLFDEVRFEKGRTYEDLFIIADLLAHCDVVAADLEPFYYYLHREGTITTEKYSARTMDLGLACEHAYEVVQRECPEALPEALFRLTHGYFGALDIILTTGGPESRVDRNRCVKFLRSHAKEILASPHTGGGRKLAMRALQVSVGLYKLFVKADEARFRAHS